MKTSKILITLLTLSSISKINSQTGTTTVITTENTTNCEGLVSAPWQGSCSADWAIAVAGAVERQLCVRKTVFKTLKISYQDLLCNCDSCHVVKNNGCLGGKVDKALDFFKSKGPVGGAANGFNSNQPTFKTEDKGPTKFKYCLNYYGEECYNINISGTKQCTAGQNVYDHSKVCTGKCNHGVETGAKPVDDYREAGLISSFSTTYGESNMKNALSGGKSVLVGFMEIYEDIFFAQAGKIYIHTTGQSLGIHAVQILGYNTENGMGYWQVLLPFGKEVAGGGVVNVLAGVNHCNIEDVAYYFTVKLEYTA